MKIVRFPLETLGDMVAATVATATAQLRAEVAALRDQVADLRAAMIAMQELQRLQHHDPFVLVDPIDEQPNPAANKRAA